MAQWIKQSTSITAKIGPFLDSTDGITPEDGLTIAQADIRLSKNGGNFAQSNDINGGAIDENGWYDITLDATDTNTLGRLVVSVQESGALPIWHEFMVQAPEVFDTDFGTDGQFKSAIYMGLGLVKVSAATQILVGPFLSIDDGAPITVMTVANITCAVVKTAVPAGTPTRLSITLAASGTSNDFVSVGDGYWRLEVTTSNTDTVGDVSFTFRDDDVFMPVHARGQVVPANIYDSWIGGSDFIQVDAREINDELLSGNNATLSLAKISLNNSGGIALEIDGVPASGEGVVDIRSATDDTFAMLIRSTATGNTSNALRIQNAATGGTPAAVDAALFIGSQGADAPGMSFTTAGGVSAAISVVNAEEFTDSNIPANLKAVNKDTNVADNIETAGNGGSFDWGGGGTTCDLTKIAGVAADAVALGRASTAVASFTVDAGGGGGVPTTTQFDCDSTEATDDQYNGRRLVFISGANLHEAATILNYTGATKRITLASAMTAAPSDNDRFIIIG